MKYALLPTLFLLSFTLVHSQNLQGLRSPAEVRILCDRFMDQMAAGSMAEAFDLLKPVSNLQEAEYDESVSKGIKQFGLIEPKFGKPYAYKFVREEEIADVALRLTYVLKCENHGLRFVFLFYKGKNEQWGMEAYNWDDKIFALFE